MSNEYKDWCWNSAQDYISNTIPTIEEIEYITNYKGGYLILAKHNDNTIEPYYVRLDDIDGWSYRSFD